MDVFNVDTLSEVYHNAGWLGLAGALLTGIVSAISSDTFQNLLGAFAPRVALWETWPDWLRRLFMFSLATIGGVLTAVAGHMSWPAALVSVIPVAASAHIFHAAGKWHEQKNDIEKALDYANRTYARQSDESLSIVAPLDRQAFKQADQNETVKKDSSPSNS